MLQRYLKHTAHYPPPTTVQKKWSSWRTKSSQSRRDAISTWIESGIGTRCCHENTTPYNQVLKWLSNIPGCTVSQAQTAMWSTSHQDAWDEHEGHHHHQFPALRIGYGSKLKPDLTHSIDHFLYKTMSLWWSRVFIHQSSHCRLEDCKPAQKHHVFLPGFSFSTKEKNLVLAGHGRLLCWDGQTGKHKFWPSPSTSIRRRASPLRIICQRLVQCQHLP